MMHLFRRFQSVVLAGGVVLLGLVGCSKEKQADGYREKAREYFAAGDYERARLEYLNLGRLVGEDPEIVSRLGMILQDQGATFQAAPILLKAAQLDPDNAELKGRVAQIYLAGVICPTAWFRRGRRWIWIRARSMRYCCWLRRRFGARWSCASVALA